MDGHFSLSVTDAMVALVRRCNPDRGVLYMFYMCSLFDSICIFAIKCQYYLHLLSYYTLIPMCIPLISKLGPPESGEQHLCSPTTRYKKKLC